MADIKRVLRNIYKFDFTNSELEDGYEMITINGINEFVNTFKKRDMDNGIIVTPGGYSRGLIYKSTNNGEFYNNPAWLPETISFDLDVYGLKKGYFYKLTVISRNVSKYNNITDSTSDRSLNVITNTEEMLLHEDVSNEYNNKEYTSVFRANSTEMDIHFKIGKIYISDIIIDEIELLDDDAHEEEHDVVVAEGKVQLAAYGIFDPKVSPVGRYTELDMLSGKGLRMYYDNLERTYILERDNVIDVLQASFTNIEYFLDINTSKLPVSDKFDRVIIVNNDNTVSPNTLKQGYTILAFLDKNGNRVCYSDMGRLLVFVKKIY